MRAPVVPAYAETAAADGSGRAARGDLVLTQSHDRHATEELRGYVWAAGAVLSCGCASLTWEIPDRTEDHFRRFLLLRP